MKITIVSVGKSHDPLLRDAIAAYEARLKKYASISWLLIPSSSPESETVQIQKHLSGMVVLLDETGTLLTTPALADMFESAQNTSVKQLTCIIGGAYGVSDEVKRRADFTWSLSPLVFPHQLVRLMLVEQLYRAYDILHNGKYHHG